MSSLDIHFSQALTGRWGSECVGRGEDLEFYYREPSLPHPPIQTTSSIKAQAHLHSQQWFLLLCTFPDFIADNPLSSSFSHHLRELFICALHARVGHKLLKGNVLSHSLRSPPTPGSFCHSTMHRWHSINIWEKKSMNLTADSQSDAKLDPSSVSLSCNKVPQ